MTASDKEAGVLQVLAEIDGTAAEIFDGLINGVRGNPTEREQKTLLLAAKCNTIRALIVRYKSAATLSETNNDA